MARVVANPRLRSLFKLVIVSAFLGLASFYSSCFLFSRAHAHEGLSSLPVSVEYLINMYGPEPKADLAFTKIETFLRYKDGSVVKRFIQTFPTSKTLVTEIMNVDSGQAIYLDEATRSSNTFQRSREKILETIADDDYESCPSGVDITTLTLLPSLLNQRTVYFERKNTAMGYVDQRWMATELNCLPLKDIETWPARGNAYTTYVATSVKVGEPDETEKHSPKDYIERTPEALEAIHLAQTGEPFRGQRGVRVVGRVYTREGILAQAGHIPVK